LLFYCELPFLRIFKEKAPVVESLREVLLAAQVELCDAQISLILGFEKRLADSVFKDL